MSSLVHTSCECKVNGPFPWNIIITFTHAYRPCWLANDIELCTKQTRNRVCATQTLAVYKTARCSLILPTKKLLPTSYVLFFFFFYKHTKFTTASHSQCLKPWFKNLFTLIEICYLLPAYWVQVLYVIDRAITPLFQLWTGPIATV